MFSIHKIDIIYTRIAKDLPLQVNLDMTDSVGQGK